VHDTGATMPTKLPTISGTCPHYSAGSGNTVTFSAGGGSIQAQVWAGSPTGGGPLILYWNGTASSPGGEIPIAFNVSQVTGAGGLIVGFVSGSRTGPTGADTGGDLYWYSTDVAMADQAVACAIDQYKIDTRHIHVAGYSAGALQTVYMWHARSAYVASVISYSGGEITINDAQTGDAPFENSGNIEPAIAAHGATGSDNLIVDFANASTTWEQQIKQAGGFSIDCNDGGNHTDFFTKRAPGLQPVAWKFFNDHPYGVKPEPYTSLPSGFPTYCKID
jgi:dienelactone hydrolase